MHSPQSSMPSNHSDTPSNFKENSHENSAALLDAISHYTDKKKKPKRNRSAFILFSIDKRSQIKDKDLESLNPNDKFVRIAELWKGLSKEEKKVYEDKAKQEKNRYANELNDFCKIFPSEPIQRPRNHIKKPCNAYGYYLKEIKEEIRQEFPNLRMCEVLRIVGDRWKNLDSQRKSYFEKKAEADRQNFKLQISKQPQIIIKASSNKSKVTNIKVEEDMVHKSPKAQKQVKMNEIVNEAKLVKSSDNKPIEVVNTHKASISSLSPLHEQENVREFLNKTPIILQTPQQPVPIGDLPTRKSSFSSINNNYSGVNNAFSNYVASPLQENTLNNSAKFLGLLDMYLKVDLLRQNIFMQLQSMSANNNQLLSINNADQINYPILGQLDSNNAELLSKIDKNASLETNKIKKEGS